MEKVQLFMNCAVKVSGKERIGIIEGHTYYQSPTLWKIWLPTTNRTILRYGNDIELLYTQDLANRTQKWLEQCKEAFA